MKALIADPSKPFQHRMEGLFEDASGEAAAAADASRAGSP